MVEPTRELTNHGFMSPGTRAVRMPTSKISLVSTACDCFVYYQNDYCIVYCCYHLQCPLFYKPFPTIIICVYNPPLNWPFPTIIHHLFVANNSIQTPTSCCAWGHFRLSSLPWGPLGVPPKTAMDAILASERALPGRHD